MFTEGASAIGKREFWNHDCHEFHLSRNEQDLAQCHGRHLTTQIPKGEESGKDKSIGNRH